MLRLDHSGLLQPDRPYGRGADTACSPGGGGAWATVGGGEGGEGGGGGGVEGGGGGGAFRVFKALNIAIMAGVGRARGRSLPVRAFGPGPLGVVRSVALGLTAGLPLGVLKGTATRSRWSPSPGCASLWSRSASPC